MKLINKIGRNHPNIAEFLDGQAHCIFLAILIGFGVPVAIFAVLEVVWIWFGIKI